MGRRGELFSVVAALVCGTLIVGCAAAMRDHKGPVDMGSVNVAGTWDALITTVTQGRSDNPTGSQRTAISTIAQSGSNLSGTFITSKGLSGQIIGTISGETFIFAIVQGNPCLAAFSGRGTITASGQEINGSYSGFDCGGDLEQTIVAKRR